MYHCYTRSKLLLVPFIKLAPVFWRFWVWFENRLRLSGHSGSSLRIGIFILTVPDPVVLYFCSLVLFLVLMALQLNQGAKKICSADSFDCLNQRLHFDTLYQASFNHVKVSVMHFLSPKRSYLLNLAY